MIERDFDVSFIAGLALREKQIQQNYRPVIAVHKWFARRPGSLFRGLLLAEFCDGPLAETYYTPQNLNGTTVADPFMGGGTPLLEANRVGCGVLGFDINPMAFWVVQAELAELDLAAYTDAAWGLRRELERHVGRYYQTTCTVCGNRGAAVKYFLWVKRQPCSSCGKGVDLFPGYLVAQNRRHPKNVFVCPSCGQLAETAHRKSPGTCPRCDTPIPTAGPARRNRCVCAACGAQNTYPVAENGPPQHRLFALEYHCSRCKPGHQGRFFKAPDADDHARVDEAEQVWQACRPSRFVPADRIPTGDETNRLHRWGYRHYSELFNPRQLHSLELSARLIAAQPDKSIRFALATNFSDLLRYQNMVCRYDAMALKSLDIFSVHGFPVGLIECESNVLGIWSTRRKTSVGSGGWSNIIDKFTKAKAYCQHPFEIRHDGCRKRQVPIRGERISDNSGNRGNGRGKVEIRCQDASQAAIAVNSLDAVLTDPPYFDNVQYAELMDFCYVWLRKLVGDDVPAFAHETTRSPGELTGNSDMGRGVAHFAEGLSAVFCRMAEGLKPGQPLAFTYHHNDLRAYHPVAVALLDAGLVCSASLPCPAEMGASIHISGTGSSITDTVFVTRSTGSARRRLIVERIEDVAGLVNEDADLLLAGGMRPTKGDLRCIFFGHVVRLAIWRLRTDWDKSAPINERLERVANWCAAFGSWEEADRQLAEPRGDVPARRGAMEVAESPGSYEVESDEVSF